MPRVIDWDDEPREPHFVTKEVGDCKLVFGDCRKYLAKLPWHSIDMVLTDPPYGISYQTNNRVMSETPDVIHGDGDLSVMEETIPLVAGKLKRDGAMYCFCSPKNVDSVLPIVRNAGLKIKNLLVWDKTNWSQGDLLGSYGGRYEHIIYAVKGTRKLNARLADIFTVSRVIPVNQIHPNQKPEKLLRILIENTTQPGDMVVDPFLGSGSTAQACLKTGRRFLGCETHEPYFRSAVAALQHAQARMR